MKCTHDSLMKTSDNVTQTVYNKISSETHYKGDDETVKSIQFGHHPRGLPGIDAIVIKERNKTANPSTNANETKLT